MRKTTKLALFALTLCTATGTAGMTGYAAAGAKTDAVNSLKPLYEVRTFAGSGAFGLIDDKPSISAFREPSSLLFDPKDHAYLAADTRNQKLRYVSSTEAATVAGIYFGEDEWNAPLGSLLDGAADKAAFNEPEGLAEDANENVYVADAGNNAIRKIDNNGNVTTIAGSGLYGSADGKGADATFNHPMDIAVSKTGVVYVADTLNHAIRQIKDGVVSTLTAPSSRLVEYTPGAVEVGGDYADGPIAQAKFNEPSGLAIDAKGNLYVSDTGNDRIRYIDFASGKVKTVAGGKTGAAAAYAANATYAEGGYADGAAENAQFRAPRGIAVTPEGGLLIADSLNHVIRYLLRGNVTTVAGTPGEAGRTDGLAASALLNKPADVVWLGGGAFAVADSGSNSIREVVPYAVPANVKADGSIHLLYGSSVLTSDADPVIKQGVTFVPVRVIAEKLGYAVQYSGGQTTLKSGSTAYTVKAGSGVIVKQTEGQPSTTMKLNVSPFNLNGRLFLPVRFFAEELGLDVQWLADSRSVLLRDHVFAK